MPDEIKYEVLNVPLIGRNLAASRTPRFQPSVPEEFSEMLSDEVARGEWSVCPDTGKPLHVSGQYIPDRLEFRRSKDKCGPRTHWDMPVVLEDEADEVWLSGNLTKHGQRLVQLEKFCGSKAAALVMFREEAERYGVKPFTTQVGTKPGEEKKSDAKKATESLTSNPYSDRWRGTEAERIARIANVIKGGTKLAEALARAAGTTVGKPLRRAT